tara:strand:+ start:4798 stop:6444 length:1647 start_codon:yes stop_codon:yes gene_type:complete
MKKYNKLFLLEEPEHHDNSLPSSVTSELDGVGLPTQFEARLTIYPDGGEDEVRGYSLEQLNALLLSGKSLMDERAYAGFQTYWGKYLEWFRFASLRAIYLPIALEYAAFVVKLEKELKFISDLIEAKEAENSGGNGGATVPAPPTVEDNDTPYTKHIKAMLQPDYPGHSPEKAMPSQENQLAPTIDLHQLTVLDRDVELQSPMFWKNISFPQLGDDGQYTMSTVYDVVYNLMTNESKEDKITDLAEKLIADLEILQLTEIVTSLEAEPVDLVPYERLARYSANAIIPFANAKGTRDVRVIESTPALGNKGEVFTFNGRIDEKSVVELAGVAQVEGVDFRYVKEGDDIIGVVLVNSEGDVIPKKGSIVSIVTSSFVNLPKEKTMLEDVIAENRATLTAQNDAFDVWETAYVSTKSEKEAEKSQLEADIKALEADVAAAILAIHNPDAESSDENGMIQNIFGAENVNDAKEIASDNVKPALDELKSSLAELETKKRKLVELKEVCEDLYEANEESKKFSEDDRELLEAAIEDQNSGLQRVIDMIEAIPAA